MELSRNQLCKHIFIVGKKKFAIERLYKTLCIHTQWTALTENIVDNLSISINNSRGHRAPVLDQASDHPLRVRDMDIPQTNSGFVYMLISTMDPSRVYVGQTKNLAIRLNQHNSGSGSEGTDFYRYMPWSVGAYMTGMGHLSKKQRMSLEFQWKDKNQASVRNGNHSIEQYIENGRRVVQEYNGTISESHPEHIIKYIVCIQRQWAPELFDYEDDGGETPVQNQNGDGVAEGRQADSNTNDMPMDDEDSEMSEDMIHESDEGYDV